MKHRMNAVNLLNKKKEIRGGLAAGRNTITHLNYGFLN